MSDPQFDQIEATFRAQGAGPALDRLIADLRTEKRYHALFDALLMKKRLELGLPLTRPTSLKDVPDAQRDDFERHYIDKAREVGSLLVAEGSLAQAWRYFRAINEPEPVARAIDALPDDEETGDEIIDIALIQGVAPVKGLKMFLASRGTCSTITAFDQQYLQMAPEFRKKCAQVLVRKLYDDLRANVAHDVERREGRVNGESPLGELIADRDALFADNAYHIDVSHLNAVVRFGRALDRDTPELELALELAEYGARLSAQYQYAGTPPFADFYPAHCRYFQALLGREQDAAISYFRNQLTPELTETDTHLTAYVLVDLLLRLNRQNEALELACRYLADSAEDFGLSLPELCAAAGRFDLLQQVSRDKGDVVHYTAALLSAAKT
ncbi:MAG: hypothetical protein ACT4QC_18815 [Planctomycetaceae bacterium]